MKFRSRPPRFIRFAGLLPFTLFTLMMFAGEAAADFQRVGPINPAPTVGNFPAWYQDNTGIALEFCDPKSDAELDGAWCLVTRDAPGLPGVLSVPENFPSNFFDEHFYYSVTAVFPASPLTLLWESALEAAFSTGGAVPGAQITFTRIRIRLQDVPVNGTYTFTHPYGVIVIDNAVVGDRIFITEDAGVSDGVFTGALKSKVGPFLLPSATAGGAELAAVVGPAPDNNLYIADPTRVGPVTGSPFGASRNFVRIDGPSGSNLDGLGHDFIQTSNFSMVGRVFSGEMPGNVTVNRAEYARSAAGEIKVEVYATGLETTPKRVPAQLPKPPLPFQPQLSFFDAPCVIGPDGYTFIAPASGTETQMFHADNSYWAPAPLGSIPAEVCVKDNVSLAGFAKAVGDEITISEAYFDPFAQSLSVKARSGDAFAPLPTLTLEGFGELTNGSILVPTLVAPPAFVRVLSSAGGSSEFQVTTSLPVPSAPPPATGVTLTSVPASPQVAGAPVAFIAGGQGGSGIYEYQFWLRTGANWAIAQPYSKTSTWIWDTTGAANGTYFTQVDVRSAGSAAASEASNNVAYQIVPPAATAVTLSVEPAAPRPAGENIVFTASGQGGSGTYEYQFWLKTGPNWAVVRPYSDNSTWIWNTTGADNAAYFVQVDVRSAGSIAPAEAASSIGYGIGPPTTVTLTDNVASPQTAATPIAFTATGAGGSGTFEYRFWLKSSGGWTVVQPYGPSAVWDWPVTGRVPGDYAIQVDVRGILSTSEREAAESMLYTITP
jgi:hypothetical protein